MLKARATWSSLLGPLIYRLRDFEAPQCFEGQLGWSGRSVEEQFITEALIQIAGGDFAFGWDGRARRAPVPLESTPVEAK
jgi:hypothetical protein